MNNEIPVIKMKLTARDIWDFTVLRKQNGKILNLLNRYNNEDIIIKCPYRPDILITQNKRNRMYQIAVLYTDNNNNDIIYYIYITD